MATNFEILVEDVSFSPSNLFSLCWKFLTKTLPVSQPNQLNKILLSPDAPPILNPPLDSLLPSLPPFNGNKLFYKIPMQYRFGFINNFMLNFLFEEFHNPIFTDFNCCMVCDTKTLFLPGDFYFHSCQ